MGSFCRLFLLIRWRSSNAMSPCTNEIDVYISLILSLHKMTQLCHAVVFQCYLARNIVGVYCALLRPTEYAFVQLLAPNSTRTCIEGGITYAK